MRATICPTCGHTLNETETVNVDKPATQPAEGSPMNMFITIAIIFSLAWAVYAFLIKPTSC
jgi:hypothetical protein